MANGKRIAKNALLLYVRMGLTMLVTLYTSRIVLKALGFDDYGIYNVVGSVILSLSFLCVPMSTATQRYFNFELGKCNYDRLNLIFNHSVYIYVLLSILIIILIEIGGLWFIAEKMVLPEGRREVALLVFEISLGSFVVLLLRNPYEAMILAHENMSFYAYIAILEVSLNLANAYIVLICNTDKLILYAFNKLVINILCTASMIFYCKRKYVYVYLKRCWDKSLFKELIQFFGWNLFGAAANMSASQGLNLLLNLFFGVYVNAAMGIANQVKNAVNQFVSNFQIAFRPQLIKDYASNKLDSLKTLIGQTSKFSFLLIFAIVCPLIFNMEFILKLWLGKYPEYTSPFCSLQLLYIAFESLSAPMWMTMQATGKIKKYQIIISTAIFMNIVFSYIFLKLGFGPTIVLIIKCILDFSYLAIRLIFIKNAVGFKISLYLKMLFFKVLPVALIGALLTYFLTLLVHDDWPRLLFSTFGFLVCYLPLVYIIGLDQMERDSVRGLVAKYLKH